MTIKKRNIIPRECIFPFKYKGQMHYNCIKDNKNKEWCATKINKNKCSVKRGKCNKEIKIIYKSYNRNIWVELDKNYFVVKGKTYPCRKIIKLLGGNWDRSLNGWRFSNDKNMIDYISPQEVISKIMSYLKKMKEKSIKKIKLENHDKSFIPSINKKLIKSTSGEMNDIFGCKGLKSKNWEINIGTIKKKKCVKYTKKKAKQYLLKNLSKEKYIHCDSIVTPNQKKSNCWFNTFFVIFFLSDKGKKFMKFFRTLMIEGKQQNGEIIKPDSLRRSFFLLNLAIESVIGSYDLENESRKQAYLLDTNDIIENIYKSLYMLNKEDYYGDRYLFNINEYGNPLQYYNYIINYLGNDSILLLENIYIEKKNFKNGVIRQNNEKNSIQELIHVTMMESNHRPDKFPDIIPIIIYWDQNFYSEKPLDFHLPCLPRLKNGWEEIIDDGNLYYRKIDDHANRTIDRSLITDWDKEVSRKRATYKLDSIAKMTADGNHYVGFITCNGKEYYFDGYSYRNLIKFDWKKRLNQSKYFWLGNSEINFNKEYSIYFYYRVK